MNKKICTYHTVSRLEDVVKDEEAKEVYSDIGCYRCDGTDKYCKIYKSVREENEEER